MDNGHAVVKIQSSKSWSYYELKILKVPSSIYLVHPL